MTECAKPLPGQGVTIAAVGQAVVGLAGNEGAPDAVADDEEIPTPGTAAQASVNPQAKPAKKRRKSRSISVESDTSCRSQ